MNPIKITRLHFLLASLAITTPLDAQVDTLLSYDVRTTSIQQLPLPNATALSFDHTGWNIGTVDGLAQLPVVPPANPFPGAGFTDYVPAQRFFSVTDFPVRTAVKLFLFHNDTMRQVCSGIMVGPDLVLTASHCLYGVFDTTFVVHFADSLLAVPAYDNGQEQVLFGSSISAYYYLPKPNLTAYLKQDIALIRLQDPIGLKTGWVGIAFSDSLSFYQNNLFHKFSYPASVDHTDSSRAFTGDTLYYNYGRLDNVSAQDLGYNITGIRGQSGSSLIYADNTSFYSMGTQSWASQSGHTRMTRSLFPSFEAIISGNLSTTPPEVVLPTDFTLGNPYPNPFNPTTMISLSLPERANVSLRIYDIMGRSVATLHEGFLSAGVHQFVFNAIDQPSGVYLLRCHTDNFQDTRKLLLMK